MVASSYYSHIPAVQCSQCGEPFDFGDESAHRCKTDATSRYNQSRPELPSMPARFKEQAKSNHRMSMKYAASTQDAYPNARDTYSSRVDSFLDVYDKSASAFGSFDQHGPSPLAGTSEKAPALSEFDFGDTEDSYGNYNNSYLQDADKTNAHAKNAYDDSRLFDKQNNRISPNYSDKGDFNDRLPRLNSQNESVKMKNMVQDFNNVHIEEQANRLASGSSNKPAEETGAASAAATTPATGILGALGGLLGLSDSFAGNAKQASELNQSKPATLSNPRNDPKTNLRTEFEDPQNNGSNAVRRGPSIRSDAHQMSRFNSQNDPRGPPQNGANNTFRGNPQNGLPPAGSNRIPTENGLRNNGNVDAIRTRSNGQRPHENNAPHYHNPMPNTHNGNAPPFNMQAPITPPESENLTKTHYKCADCNLPIQDLTQTFEIDVLGSWFHIDCFKCSSCRRRFGDDLPYVPHLGKAFCEMDYEKYFLESCAACKKPITDGSVARAFGQSFHERHFICSVCRCQIQPGRHFEHRQKLYCQKDFSRLPSVDCASCRGPIQGDSIHAIGAVYHRQCFSCTHCRVPFPDKRFFVYENKPYCQTHYHEKNNSLCGTCSRPIEGICVDVAELRRKFHPPCWCCAYCNRPLTGVYYAYGSRAYCEEDIDIVYRSGNTKQAPTKRRTIMSVMR
ncbi:hypothetical protein QVD99_008394 [Batrachochytrium dendrobatidis]|uniref:LIM zinc-binding domain-containing protein n=1 Tax=Batrachochytrium dendrobatidis (strain JEL423) TaxID=403673 RepID=A0A177WV62_BATDL|nr:hypothetical protein QVD99_008394 [Batrachochytrium dendrobatidis]OAJ43564.1 hypothetical protein, variant 1 [Batrachochytrium dendrobatidis JEL423]